VISDVKDPDPTYTSSPIQFWKYLADVKNISNIYPYGKLYGTNAIYNASEDYRYGFNGMEKEKNMDASGDITDFGARFFDANFPMFLSPDPMERLFPSQSRYLFAGDNPIKFIDKDGKAKYYSFAGKFLGDDGQENNDQYITKLQLPDKFTPETISSLQVNRNTILMPPKKARVEFLDYLYAFIKDEDAPRYGPNNEYNREETTGIFTKSGGLITPNLNEISRYSTPSTKNRSSNFKIGEFLDGFNGMLNNKINLVIHTHPAADITSSKYGGKGIYEEDGSFTLNPGDDRTNAEWMSAAPIYTKSFGIISTYDLIRSIEPDGKGFGSVELQFYDQDGDIGRISLDTFENLGEESDGEN
jgi:RHS repeat-associated protein